MPVVYRPFSKDSALVPSQPTDYGQIVGAFLGSKPSELARADEKCSVAHPDEYLERAAAAEKVPQKKERLPRALATILKLEEHGKWHASSALAGALGGLPEEPDNVMMHDWEWPTAVVRATLTYNVQYFEDTYKSVQRGDWCFADERGAWIAQAAKRALGPTPKILRSDDDDNTTKDEPPPPPPPGPLKQHPTTAKRRFDPVLRAAIADEFEALTGGSRTWGARRDLGRLWHESWGREIVGRDAELRRLSQASEARRRAARPPWRHDNGRTN